MLNDIIQPIKKYGLFPTLFRQAEDAGGAIGGFFIAGYRFLFGPSKEIAADGNDKLYLTVTILSVIFSLFLASISFAGSFTAARAYAEAHGIAASVAAWIPVSVDGFILLGILVVFGASLVAAGAGWVRFLIFTFAAISVIFNVTHILETLGGKILIAPQHVLLGSIFPVVVFLASEVTSKQITAYIKRRSVLRSNDELMANISSLKRQKRSLAQEIEGKRVKMLAEAEASVKAELIETESKRDSLQAIIGRLETRLKRLNTEVKQAKSLDEKTRHLIEVAYWYGDNGGITGSEIGKRIGGKSAQYGNDLKRKVKETLNGAKVYAS